MTRQFAPSPAPILLLAFIFYLNFISRIILAPLLPAIEHSLGITHGQAGTLFLCISSGYFISLPCSGFVSARLGHKRAIVTTMAAISVSMLAISAASSLPFLQITFFLLGLSAGPYLPSAIATITELCEPRQLGKALGLHEIAPNLAFLSAPLLVAWLLPTLHWQEVTLLLAATSATAALVYSLAGKNSLLKGTAPTFTNCRELAAQPAFWLMVILFAMGITATLGIYSVLPMFLVSEQGMDKHAANTLIGLSRTTTLATAFLGGWLADKFGFKQTMAVVLLLSGLFTVLIGLSPARLLPYWIWLQPFVAVCFFAPGFALLSQTGPTGSRNIVISLTIPSAFVIGGGLVPAAIARLADIGYFPLGLTLAGLFIASGCLLVALLPSAAEQ
ncbi:MAG: MFS transporter [Desulfobulbus sp.]|nr:MAG: MFS transporter [Desulfobulbus sp.]RUM39773.1 MAG: MFS transporter [Desulfobulbus sp.]